MKKTLNILLTIALIIVLCVIGFLVAGVLVIQDKYEPEKDVIENVKQTENKVSEMELEKKYTSLKAHFGEENIQIDYRGDSFNEIRITHLPTGKQQFGTENKTQIENAIQALEKLKLELDK